MYFKYSGFYWIFYFSISFVSLDSRITLLETNVLIISNFSFPMRKSMISRFIFKLYENLRENLINSLMISVSILNKEFIKET